MDFSVLSISTASSDKSTDSISSPHFKHFTSTSAFFEVKPTLSPKTEQKRNGGLRIEGHRGAGLLEPENTMKAFQRAIDLKIDGVELDVWLSKDGIPIVVHATDEGLVHFRDNELNTLAFEVHSHDLREWKLPNEENIPTLEEVLLLCKDKIHVNIELKEENVRVVKPTLELVLRLGMLDQVCFSSFVHKHKLTLEEARKELKIQGKVEFGFLVYQLQDFIEYKETATSGDTLNIDIELLMKHEEFILGEIAKAKEKGMKIKFYFGFEIEETHEVYKRLEDLHVDTLIINHPLKSLDFLNQETC